MSLVPDEDLARFAEGHFADSEQHDRIAAAIDDDPATARRFDEVVAALMPSPQTSQLIQDQRERLPRLVYAQLQPVGGDVTDDRWQAALQLPGELIPAQVEHMAEGLRLSLERLPAGMRPATIALFTPATTVDSKAVLQLSKVARRTAPPSVELHVVGSLAAASGGVESPITWKTDPVTNEAGVTIWLEEHRDLGVILRCTAARSSFPLAWGDCRARWQEAGTGTMHERQCDFRLEPAAAGTLQGHCLLKTRSRPLRDADAVEVEVMPLARDAVKYLTFRQLQAVQRDDLESLILVPMGRDNGSYAARFCRDEQRRVWHAPAACRFIRFDPA